MDVKVIEYNHPVRGQIIVVGWVVEEDDYILVVQEIAGGDPHPSKATMVPISQITSICDPRPSLRLVAGGMS